MPVHDHDRWEHLVRAARPAQALYGSLEPMVRALRDHNPRDLCWERWRGAHPGGTFEEWAAPVRAWVLEQLHYDPGPLDLQPEVLSRETRPGYVLERVAFQTTPWIRVQAYLLLPESARPAPAVVLLHEWGGPMLWGKDRLVPSGRDHPLLQEHRAHYDGVYPAETFARAGYAVLVIDAHHFGDRAPRGLHGLPADFDPYALEREEALALCGRLAEHIYLGLKYLNWAGVTWMGLNFWDDSRCIDYLLTRPEICADRIACSGLSGGAWRSLFLAALDTRIRASAVACWMSTGDHQQVFNIRGAIGVFCLLPGLWNRLDLPDLAVLAAPRATLCFNNGNDPLFPPEGQAESERRIRAGYAWAGVPGHCLVANLPKPHCYDLEMQRLALDWFRSRMAPSQPGSAGSSSIAIAT